MLKDDISLLEEMLTKISKFYTLCKYKSGMKIKQAGTELYQAQYMIRLRLLLASLMVKTTTITYCHQIQVIQAILKYQPANHQLLQGCQNSSLCGWG